MYLTLHLLLAHFLADYTFQPFSMVRLKYKSFLGILLHTFVHLVVITILCIPFLDDIRVIWGIGIIFVTHNIIDYSKITCEKKFPKWNRFALYAADQILHFIVIFSVALILIGKTEPFLTGWWYKYYSDKSVVSFFLILTLVTYFYDVTRWSYLNSIKARPYKRDYKMMVRNALIVVVAFGVYWITQ